MKNALTVIVPVHNEDIKNVDALISRLNHHKIPHIIVDDGSDLPIYSDWFGWHSKTKKGSVTNEEAYTTVIRLNKNKGYGAAIKFALKHTKSKYIGIIDADGQYDVMDLIDMWQSMNKEDMIIGKRINHQGGWKRFWGRLGIKLLASIAAGQYIKDINSGVRIFKRHLAKSYASILCDEFSFTTSLTLAMILDGYKVRWVDANFYPREGATSTVREFRHGLITLHQILKITIGLRTRKLRERLRK